MKPQFENHQFVHTSLSLKNVTRFAVALCMGLALWAWMGADTQVGAQAQPAKKIVMKFGHLQATDSAIHMGCEKFADLMKQKTGGQVEVQIFPNSQLGNAKSQLQALNVGGQDMFVDGIGWYVDYDKDWTPLALGFAIKDRAEMIKILSSPIGKDLEARILKEGIRVAAYNWWKGDRCLISRKPIRTVNDLKNVKMRVPSKAFFVTWQALGSQPVVIAWAELFIALQQGVVDAAEGPIGDLYTMKFYEPAKYITLTRHLVNTAAVSVSEKLYKGWPPAIQKAVLEASVEAGEAQTRFQLHQEKEAMEKMKAAKVTFIDTDVKAWQAKVKNLPEKAEAEGQWSKGLWAKMQAVMKK
jgi:TRAP-type transport system periplasmic protein